MRISTPKPGSPFIDNPRILSDQQLAAHARACDRDQLETLFTCHLPWIFNSLPPCSTGLRQVLELAPPDSRTAPVPVEILMRETGNNCLIGSLFCSGGSQRLPYSHGELTQV